MASITIRNLDDSPKIRLRVQAATHGRSMEDEARDILRSALSREPARKGNWLLPSAPGLRRWGRRAATCPA